MLMRYVKMGVLALVLAVLAVEGFFVHRWYDRYYNVDAASPGVVDGSAVGPKTVADAGSGEVAFVHTAADGNSHGDYTYLSDPRIDGDPNAVVLVTPKNRAAPYGHNIGVWYEAGARKWAIFDQDRAAVPAGAAFAVTIPRASGAFVHRASPTNTAGDATRLDDPLTNRKPDAAVSVTQNWNPGGGRGVYNDHPIGARYDRDARKWAVYNKDGARMPEGAAFNVAVDPRGARPAR